MSTPVRFRSTGRVITFDQSLRLASGGEGVVYILPNEPSRVVKIYHPGKATPERCRKLEVMVNNPPADQMLAKGHASIAWPTELLEYTGSTGAGLTKGQVIGYVMPRLGRDMSTIGEFYDPKSRIRSHPAFNYKYLMRAARNFVSSARALHSVGYVIGDVNESNLMVDRNSALTTVVDTDSFQVSDPSSGAIFRCTVGKEDFTPPELQGRTFSQIDRNQAHDLFGIGVILFQLLMENTQPFGGKYTGAGDPPEYGVRIRNGFFPYCQKRQVPFRPGRFAPPFAMLHPDLQQLFIRCFEDGHSNPNARPDARTWGEALKRAEAALVCCTANSQHYFGSHLSSCPWCQRAQNLGIDPFPSQSQAKATQQAFTPRPRPAPQRPAPFWQAAAATAAAAAAATAPAPAPVPAPAIHNFYASNASLITGQSCTLSWYVTNAQRVTIDNGVGQVQPNGNVTVTPLTNTTYTLIAQGVGGTVPATVRVTVSKPSPILSFNANVGSIIIGQQTTLHWNVAPTHSAHLNKGIGKVPNTGQITVTPLKSTSYVLTAKGAGWPVKQRVRIAVTLPPLPIVLNAYSTLNAPSIALAQYAPLSAVAVALKPFVALGNFIKLNVYGKLAMFGKLHPITVGLNNYVPLRKPPKSKPRLSAMPFYQRLPIKAFNNVAGLVNGVRKGRRLRKTARN
jgi:hypothetical protein